MNYLAIDTSNKNLTVVVCKNNEYFKYYDENCGVNHSVCLMPKVEELLIKSGLNLKDADFIACVVGAGSFTGIRIGVSTVKALCFAYGKPLLSITSFDTIAYNKESGKVLAVIDAKHNGFYVAGYENKKQVVSPRYVLKDQLELYKDYEFLTGEETDNINAEKVDTENGLIRAIIEKQNSITYDLDTLTPLYCRQSQAEEGRP